MSLIATATRAVERLPLPDAVTKAGIDFLLRRATRRMASSSDDFSLSAAAFAREMATASIAEHVDAANEQHYELPPQFFGLTLGPHRKYSCCLYPDADASLADAEAHALAETVAHADLADGQSILELGCGWGSLSLYMAKRFPNARITAVSYSAPQRQHIEAEAVARGITNLTIITADMNVFQPAGQFDRIVSVEMFEHMSNWRALLTRARSWLLPDGRMFIHVFTHKNRSYRFDHTDKSDWIAQYFFSGGIMPSHDLIHQYPDLFTVEQEWKWNGRHYARTALDWLKNFDANIAEIDRILVEVYGPDAALWRRRWRLFYLATAGLFGFGDGTEWAVGHYRLAPVVAAQPGADSPSELALAE